MPRLLIVIDLFIDPGKVDKLMQIIIQELYLKHKSKGMIIWLRHGYNTMGSV